MCALCYTDATKRWTPKLVADQPIFEKDMQGNCETCPALEDCQERLADQPRAWVLCEIPDELDLIGVEESSMLVAEAYRMANGKDPR